MLNKEYNAVQIQGIDAETLISNFKRIENQILELQNSSQSSIDKLISTADAAKLLSVSKVTIHNWIKSSILKGYRVGNKVRLKESEVFSSLQKINS